MRRANLPQSSQGSKPPVTASLIRLIKLALPYRGRFSLALLALMIGSAINLVFPELIRRALDPAHRDTLSAQLPVLMAGLGLLFVVQGVAFYLRSYLFGWIGQAVYSDLRRELFEALLSKDVTFFDRNRSGELSTRISSDAALVQDAVAIKLSVIIRYGFQVVCGVVLMAWMSWQLTLALVMSVLIMVGVSAGFIRSLKAASRRYQTNLAHLTSFAAECFSGAKIIRSLGASGDVTRRYRDANMLVLQAGRERVGISARFSSGASLLLNLLLLVVLWFGLHLVFAESLPLNELAAFILYGAIVAVSFSFLVGAYSELMQGLGGLERVFELIESSALNESQDAVGSLRVGGAPVTVELKHVHFSYPDRADNVVLEDFCADLRPGSVTALIGPSGSGKSTIAQLLLKLYTPTSGEIRFNGRPLHEVSEEELRASIAWVPQEPELFGFSLFDNLTLGNNTLLRDEVLKTVQAWEFLDFIEPMEHGIDTVLGEHGALVSGGQRQRIAIARALLRKPSLLILDEATSGLDSHTEAQVMETIRRHIPTASLLVISHRLATVRSADTIYVLNEGRVFEQGSHDQLVAHEGLYHSYVTRQALR